MTHSGTGRPAGSGGVLSGPSLTSGHTLRLVAWETTRRCNLACKHCRAVAEDHPYENELSTQEAFALLDQIRQVGTPIIILTGGEPLLREDIFDIAAYGTRIGLRMVMAPNGTLITPDCKKTQRQRYKAHQREPGRGHGPDP
jgi:AdoMet-dependent heme synthase